MNNNLENTYKSLFLKYNSDLDGYKYPENITVLPSINYLEYEAKIYTIRLSS